MRQVICGPMFAGKTTTALRRVGELRALGHKVLVISFAGDTRYEIAKLASHTGETMSCTAVAADGLQIDLLGDHTIVVIDEAHFFTGLLDFVQSCDDRGVGWVVAGIDLLADRSPAGHVLETSLLDGVETVQLQACCSVCDQPAPFTSALVADAGVGGSESYAPRCSKHFIEPPPPPATQVTKECQTTKLSSTCSSSLACQSTSTTC